MENEQREKCSGKPERKKGSFPYRPKGAPRPQPLDGVPGPDHPRFATIRPFFVQRKDDAERARLEHLEAHRRQVEATTDAKIRRALEREEAEHQRGIDDFWHSLKRKVRPERRPDHGVAERKPVIPRGGRAIARPPFQLAAYPGPIVDRRGRIGIFMSSTYLAAKTTEYGCMKRLAYYVTKPDHLESEQSFFSNMGEDRHEIACGMSLVEDANRAARANGKVTVTHIIQLPHDVTPEQRMTILRVWCEEKLGIHDLPYVAAVHKPSPDGDQRNYHGHVVTSFRPAYRTGRYAWRIGRSPRTDLDNPAMFEEYRCDFATIMTAVVQIAGKDRIYTHLSNAARGLKHKSTEKLGPHKTRAVRDGEYVPANERNRRTIATNETLAAVDRLDMRAEQNQRRIARLMALKAIAARPLSRVVEAVMREQAKRVSALTAGVSPALPKITNALLAAAARATDALRLAMTAPDDADAPALVDAPTLQQAMPLDDTARVPSIPAVFTHFPIAARLPSGPIAEAVRADGQARNLSAPIAVATDSVTPGVANSRRPSSRVDVDRKRDSIDYPTTVAFVTTTKPICRLPSKAIEIDATGIQARHVSRSSAVERRTVRRAALSVVATIEQRHARCVPPARVSVSEHTLTTMARYASSVAEPTPPRSLGKRLPSSVIVKPRDEQSTSAISNTVDVAPSASQPVRMPSRVRPVDIAQHDIARIRQTNSGRISRLDSRVAEIEREARAQADAAKALEPADRQQREQRRFLRFLAFIALNPDWLADGSRGIEMAAHAPPKIRAAFASWANDHVRLQIVADVRQTTLDGIHRLPSDLARDIERTIADLAPRLAPPPPLRDANGRVAPAGEVAMAIVAHTPHLLAASSDPPRLSSDAPPALARMVARYRDDLAFPALLLSARHHGEGVAGAIELSLAHRIDQRRLGFGLRRAKGSLPVLTPARDRLSSAMIDHLAYARLHPKWIRHDPHLGLGLEDTASTMFREQWARWRDPGVARRMLIENASAPARNDTLTPAMRAQVTARVEVIAGAGGGNAGARIDPTIDRSR